MKELEKIAESLLESDGLEQAKKWYEETLDPIWEYVVFVVRRCYILALVLEKITGKCMEKESRAAFLTDAAFYLRCEEMAQRFRETECFPNMLLCDDVLVHGRNLNHLLGSIQRKLYELLPEYDRKKIDNAFVKAVRIHVVQRSDLKLLLEGSYVSKLQYKKVVRPVMLHKASVRASELISACGMANACYIFSEHFSRAEFLGKTDIEKWGEGEVVTSSFQNVSEYSWVWPIGTNGRVKAVFTLRMFQDSVHGGYRAVPFIFLPNLGREETAGIFNEVLGKIGKDHPCGKWLQELERIEGKRSFNELLSLIISNVVLQEFNIRYDIQPDQLDRQHEIRKLARNYNQYGLEKTEQYLDYLIGSRMFRLEELERILVTHISEERYIVQLREGSAEELSREKIRHIVKREESFFYEKGRRDEQQAYEASRYLYIPDVWRLDRFVRGACFDLRQLFDGYSRQEFAYGMAYFLQMMDAGILSLSSYASQNIRVVGYAQFLKAGEKSLFLLPLEFYIYIPMLTAMQYRGEQLKGGMKGEIARFRESGYSDIEKGQWDDIIDFVETLQGIGQTPADWDEDFLSKKDFSLEEGDSEISKLAAFVNKQIEYRKKYIEYTDSGKGFAAYIENMNY